MYTAQEARSSLREIEWQEGKVVPIAEGPYRYRMVVHCSVHGRERATFANGEYSYFCYVELLAGNGELITGGVAIVPILSDGRLIMVVEQRPAQSRFSNRPTVAQIGGRSIDLSHYGPYSSLEFPGGAIDPGEGLKAAFLRELIEETDVKSQTAVYYKRCQPIYHYGSEIPIQLSIGVVFLSGLSYSKQVKTDGGLAVFALTPDEVQQNIWNGVICSGQAALLPWAFYEEVEEIRESNLESELVDSGYLGVEKIKIAKPILPPAV